jgi:hypothetical protein
MLGGRGGGGAEHPTTIATNQQTSERTEGCIDF